MLRYYICKLSTFFQVSDRLWSTVSIFLGAFSILFETYQRRIELCLYLAPKALESLENGLISRGLFPVIPHFDKILFTLSVGIIAIGSVEKKDFIKPSYDNVLKKLWK